MTQTIAQRILGIEEPYIDYDFDGRKLRRERESKEEITSSVNLKLLKENLGNVGVEFLNEYAPLIISLREQYKSNNNLLNDKDFYENLVQLLPQLLDVSYKLLKSISPCQLINLILKYNLMESKNRDGKYIDKKIAKENLLSFKKVLDENGIEFFLLYGTLLGAVREQDFISHDTDTDVGIKEKDREKLIAAIPKLMDNGFELIRTSNPDDLVTFIRNDEYIDVGIHKSARDIFGRKYWYYQNKVTHRIWNKYLKKFHKLYFLGEVFNIPNDSLGLLQRNYGPTWYARIKDQPAYNNENFKKIKRIYKIVVWKLWQLRNQNN